MRLVIRGTVQGVGFRPTVFRVARKLGAKGYVKNLGSEVEVLIDKNEELFLEELERELPPLAKIEEVIVEDSDVVENDFRIIPSSEGSRTSTIPVDTALCDDCLDELRDPQDRRYHYSFINCTNCGARYSAIEGLPYDRKKTTMSPFKMCDACKREYEHPGDRRFHAQTTSCTDCGPGYTLYNKDKEIVGGVAEFAGLMEEGEIAVAKSWGGMHIACRLQSTPELRERYGRPEKPFAIMVKDVETAKRYVKVSRKDVFAGSRRPIMIYEKNNVDDDLMELVAPGLPTVGVMLPYTPLHHLIFELTDLNALVMTSANIPGEPMIIENEDAFSLELDHFLLHDRKIANRIDDSLIRVHGDDIAPIRRSRGYVPEHLPFPSDVHVMGAGADMSGCVAFTKNRRIYSSQYLGDLDSYYAERFYRETVDHLTSLLGVDEIDTVAVDLHPKYRSRKIGLEVADDLDAQVVEVQHHWAHGASLMLEHGLDDIVCIAIDGTGYGEDGGSWGGEILYCTSEGFQRTAHLEPFPLLGGEQAVKDPLRLAYAIHRRSGHECSYFDGDTASILDKLINKSVETTSFGRLLDAVSAALGVCTERTYEGEPAMKLERLQMKGDTSLEYDVYRDGDTIYTLEAFMDMLDDEARRADKAASYCSRVAHALAEAAAEAAEEYDAPIGVSGGVSYNRPIVESIRKRLDTLGQKLYVHQRIPNGDMGVPLGQALIAAYL